MDSNNSSKKLRPILEGGIAGAFAAIVLSFTLLFFGGRILISWNVHGVFFQKFTLNQAYCFIATAGIVGSLLGAMFRKSFFIQKIRRPSLVLIFPMLLLLVVIYGCIAGIEVIRQVKIAGCNDRIINVHFKTEKGRSFSLILSPESLSPPYFTGHVRLTEVSSNRTVEFEINSNPVQTDTQSQHIQAQGEYDAVITLTPPLPPPSMSVSLKWIQRNWDR